jgi:hypothetical protein
MPVNPSAPTFEQDDFQWYLHIWVAGCRGSGASSRETTTHRRRSLDPDGLFQRRGQVELASTHICAEPD